MSEREDLYLSDKEWSMLSRSMSMDNLLHMSIGSNRLPDTPGNEWARELILEHRYHQMPSAALHMVRTESYRDSGLSAVSTV